MKRLHASHHGCAHGRVLNKGRISRVKMLALTFAVGKHEQHVVPLLLVSRLRSVPVSTLRIEIFA